MLLQVGLGVAVDYCLQLGVADTIWPRVQKLAHILRAGLMALPGVRVWDQGRILCGIVSFTKVGTRRCPCRLEALGGINEFGRGSTASTAAARVNGAVLCQGAYLSSVVKL